MSDKNTIPVHIGIIPDGNRRWAKARGLPGVEGHRQGYKALNKVARVAFGSGVSYVSVYAFSTENWKRGKDEVSDVMGIVLWVLSNEVDGFHKDGLRIRFIGSKSRLPESIIEAIKNSEDLTKDNINGTIVLCLDYGGQQEIVDAVKQIVGSGVKSDEVNQELITQSMYMPDLPAPDLIIRTSGEQRLSNFLTWQSAYSELMFIDKLWPDIDENDIKNALGGYADRNRRFGK